MVQGVSYNIKKFFFIFFIFCFAFTWQTTSLKIFHGSVSINFLLFAVFYFCYTKEEMPPSTLLIIFFGVLYDLVSSYPLCTESTILLISALTLHFYIKNLEIDRTFAIDGLIFVIFGVINYVLLYVLLFFFLPKNIHLQQVSIFNHILYNSLFYIIATPLLNAIFNNFILDEKNSIK